MRAFDIQTSKPSRRLFPDPHLMNPNVPCPRGLNPFNRLYGLPTLFHSSTRAQHIHSRLRGGTSSDNTHPCIATFCSTRLTDLKFSRYMGPMHPSKGQVCFLSYLLATLTIPTMRVCARSEMSPSLSPSTPLTPTSPKIILSLF